MASPASAAPLWNQLDDPGPWGIYSQDMNANGQYDYEDFQAADDFVVPAGREWGITSVDVAGDYSYYYNSSLGPANSFSVWFYPDNGGTPSGTDPIKARLNQAYTGEFHITLDRRVILGAGTYWVSVQARQNRSQHGSWNWIVRRTQRNYGAVYYGVEAPCNTPAWHLITCYSGNHDPDLRFRLNGTALDGLTVSKGGDGRGSVTSTPAGIDIGSDDVQGQYNRFEHGTQVTLTAKAKASAPNSIFVGWTGCDQPSGKTCVMNMNALSNHVKANFAVASAMTFRKDGDGEGSVTSEPPRIDCPPGECKVQPYSFKFPLGSQVTLTAKAKSTGPTSVFVRWTGCDHPSGRTCVMDMNDAAHTKKLVATFARASGLTFQQRGSGRGTVTSSPNAVNCGPDQCKAQPHYYKFAVGTKVTLTAVREPGSVFSGWTGCDHPSGRTCVMNMNDTAHTKKLSAKFIVAPTRR